VRAVAATRLLSLGRRGKPRVISDNPTPADPDLGEGIDGPALIVIERGEAGLADLRNNSIARWIAAGAAWKTLQLAAIYRSNSNRASGRRYSAVYGALVYRFPELARADKATRSNAIWLFERSERGDPVMRWHQSLTQTERDNWVHPTTLRRHFERRFPSITAKPARRRPLRKPPRAWNRQPLGEISREDLEAIVTQLADQLSERNAVIEDLNAVIREREEEILKLKGELAWEQIERQQLEKLLLQRSAGS
jgi:hypothetical protein